MAGGLIQLVAHGIEDLYLSSDPQITFFKVLYRRHTNFAVESVQQNFSSPANFGDTATCILSRAGDLAGQIFLYVQMPAIPKFINPDTGTEDLIKKMAWVNNLGYALISEVFIDIGGKQIDKQYGEWMYIWSQVTNRQDKGLAKMIGNIPEIYDFSNGKKTHELYIPLEFWFCRHNGLALPLVALASSEVKISVTFRRIEECYRIGPTTSIEMKDDIVPFSAGDYIEQTVNNQTIRGYVIDYDFLQKRLHYIKIHSPTALKTTFESDENDPSYRIYNTSNNLYANPKGTEKIENSKLPYQPRFVNSFLYVNYIYLDKEERLKFHKNNHEYLIEQVQFNQELNIKSPNVKQKLALRHPCKAHYWVAQLDVNESMNDHFNYTHKGKDMVKKANLIVDGHERFGERDSDYFNLIQPYQHHYRGPSPGINVYSFSLHPEDYQPSSTMNMSEIGQVFMQMKLDNSVSPYNTAKVRSYTINYNIFRIYLNVGGLAFV